MDKKILIVIIIIGILTLVNTTKAIEINTCDMINKIRNDILETSWLKQKQNLLSKIEKVDNNFKQGDLTASIKSLDGFIKSLKLTMRKTGDIYTILWDAQLLRIYLICDI